MVLFPVIFTFLMSTFVEVQTYKVKFLNYMTFEGLLRYYEEILRMLSQDQVPHPEQKLGRLTTFDLKTNDDICSVVHISLNMIEEMEIRKF